MSTTGMTILGICIIFIASMLGSALVLFLKKEISPKLNTVFLGFASGIMIAASIWSLLVPSIEASEDYGGLAFLPVAIGFLLGGGFLVLIDHIVPHFHKGTGEEEGPHIELKKPTKMFLAVTIHNIPEGLAVGFAFGGAVLAGEYAEYVSALALAIGIAIQNIPESAAVALPMKAATESQWKAFLYGTGSGAVEPVFAIIGYFFASSIAVLQPWLLALAAGAMIFVVIEDLIPDAHLGEHSHLGTWSAMLGFVVMMVLDMAL